MSVYQRNKETSILQDFKDDGTIESQEVQTITKIQKRHFRKGQFFMTSFDFIEFLLKQNYTAVQSKVLLALVQRLDYNNRIKAFRQIDIAKQIGSTQPNVSRAIKQLEKDKIIYQDGLEWYFDDDFIKGAGDK